jgi:hypothetical protein
MANDVPNDAPMDRDAFVRHVMGLLRAAGVTDPIEHNEESEKLKFGSAVVDLARGYETYRSLPPHQRDDIVEKMVRLGVKPPKPPDTWAEAKDRVLPVVQTMIHAVITDMRRGPQNPIARHQMTEHVVVEVGIPVPDATLGLDKETIDKWGVPLDELVAQAGKNLAARGAGPWKVSPELPGVFRSPWSDGYDVSRLLFGEVFDRMGTPLRGDPVAIAPNPGVLLVAGSDDRQGLVNLGLFGRRLMEQEGFFHIYRPLRRGPDGWKHWQPPEDHPAHATLGLLHAWNERSDYEAQARFLRDMAVEKKMDTPVLPPIDVRQAAFTGAPFQVVTWRQGRPTALPKADLVVLVRGKETLGAVAWDDMLRVLRGEFQVMPGYPTRWLAHTFPEGWQIGALPLQPWSGDSARPGTALP